jgi:hypothetical protein
VIAEDIAIYKGQDAPLVFDMTAYGETTLAGWSIMLSVFPTPATTPPPLAAVPGTPNSPAPGQFTVQLAGALTAGLGAGRYYWYAARTDPGLVDTLAGGFLDLLEGQL